MQNLAVDGFFVLSGFLLAASSVRIMKSTDIAPGDMLAISTRNRIKRLYPEYVFSILFTIVVSLAVGLFIDWTALPFNLVFISQINGVPGIVNGSWYISVLFWTGCIYAALLFYKRKSAVYLFVPLISLVALSIMYARYTGLSLNGLPLLYNFLSSGWLKGFWGIGVGIMTYFACKYVSDAGIRIKYPKTICFILEIVCILLLVHCLGYDHLTQKEYLVYAAYPVLIGIYYFRRETITRFLSWPKLAPITNLAYMLFLTHIVILDVIRNSSLPYHEYPRFAVYLGVVVLCVFAAYICHFVQRRLTTVLHHKLFIPKDA